MFMLIQSAGIKVNNGLINHYDQVGSFDSNL